MTEKERFNRERDRLNQMVMKYANKETKRFFSLDHQIYETGALDEKTKEFAGLVASLVLRCDDCIFYHLIRCQETGASSEEIMEILNIGLMVGGSIVIPHLRRAVARWDELQISSTPFEIQLQQAREIAASDSSVSEATQEICLYLRQHNPLFDWVGFYWINPKNPRELILGAYAGEPTEHVTIPVGKGICGQAAERKETFVIQDVRLEDNYLSCNPAVLSEIVIPIFKEGVIFGELDIDSHTESPFTMRHREFLEEIAKIVETRL